MSRLLLLSLLLVLVSGCASVQTERATPSYATADLTPFPAYDGVQKRIQVIRFGIPRDIVDKYPELADRRVGFGLSNRILEGFYDTNRFTFLEEKAEMVERMANQWKLSMAGLVSEDTEVEAGLLQAPEFLVYAEVYDFAVSFKERVVGIRSEQTNTTIMGVQLRMVDVETGEFVVGSGEGEATSTATSAFMSAELPFDDSTVGLATERALQAALRNMLKRMESRGWS